MKKFLLLFCLGLISSSLFSQNDANTFDHWFDANEIMIAIPANVERTIVPEKYRTLALDLDALKTTLAAAPMEFTPAVKNNPLIINLPMPNGENAAFKIVESPVMHPELAAKFPEIKSFAGVGVDNHLLRARIDYGTKGLRGIIDSPEGQIFIDPYLEGNNVNYLTYFKKDRPLTDYEKSLEHGTHSHQLEESLEMLKSAKGGPNSPFRSPTDPPEPTPSFSPNGDPVDLRVYRTAVATTGQFGLGQGGTVTNVLSEVVFAMSRLNFVFERETAVRFELVPNNDQIIFVDPNTDPYNGPIVTNYFNQNLITLNDIIGVGNYDIGHLFSAAGCQNSQGGGVAGTSGGTGIICTANKAFGISCTNNPSDAFYFGVMAHEVGHQLGASHTWNNCSPFQNGTDPDNPNPNPQISIGNAYEPGGGTTIMSYAGVCNSANNIQFNSDAYLHVNSVEAIQFFTREGFGNTCGSLNTTDNIEPDVTIPYDFGFYIPISTPFQLTGSATDANVNDTLTYCWEQYNTGPISPVGQPIGTAPSFRSYTPTENPTRIFPRLPAIINNQNLDEEVLPTYNRDLTFRLTVRDNKWGGGGTVWEQISFNATDAAGPFLVDFPNNSTQLEGGSYIDVLWDVANTDLGPVNCQRVNIMLSNDGGFTYPYILAEQIPNTGSFPVTIPNISSNQVRIKVEAADNIFFDISNQNSTITAPSQPGYSVATGPYYQKACLPELPVFEINTESLLNFDGMVNFEAIGLPAGATASFSANPVMASENSTMTISIVNSPNADGFFTFQLMTYVDGGDTVYQELTYETRGTDFSDLAITAPLNGTIAVPELPELSWVEANAADDYFIEIASDPSFSAASIVESNTVTGNSYTAGVQLMLGGVYFFRIRPQNECVQGAWSTVNAFAVKSLSCATAASTDGPITISGNGTPTIVSTINIPNGGNISDLNIVGIQGNHSAFKDIAMHLEGPDGTTVELFNGIICLASEMNFGLDDQGAQDIGSDCPVNTGVNYKPSNPLSIFNDKDAQGDWKLSVEVINTAGSGGDLDEWTIQLCSEANLSPPTLVNNELMPLPPADSRAITPEFLLTEDPNNTPDQLTYTIVTLPQNGKLLFGTTELVVGSKFSQQSSSAGNIRYEHDGTNTTTDSFTFTVDDGEGGLIATPQFNIELDPDIMINTEDLLEQNDISIFPNPANDIINVGFTKSLNDKISVRIFNLHGQLLQEKIVANAQELIQLNTKNFADGIYFVQVRTENQSLTERVVIQR